jgi:hypothetical protein
MVNVTLNAAGPDDEDRTLVLVMLQSPSWVFSFRATLGELDGLRSIREADWLARRSLHIGRSADAPVHWAVNGETVTILIGHDDETWDIALEVPVVTVDDIVAQAAARNW